MAPYRQDHDPSGTSSMRYAAQRESPPEERGYPSSLRPELQQVSAPGLGALHLNAHPHGLLDPRGLANNPSPQTYGSRQQMVYSDPMQQPTSGKKRKYQDMELDLSDLPEDRCRMGGDLTPMSLQAMGYESAPRSYHNHGLPETRSNKIPRLGEAGIPNFMSHGVPSVIGRADMPTPALHPEGQKAKFTQEDDDLLKRLKEEEGLKWKQISEFFPGRSSGTLQVRYCTKLKPKITLWSDETTQRLRNAIYDYENEKWRIISQKVGQGFSAMACEEKAMELIFLSQDEEEDKEATAY